MVEHVGFSKTLEECDQWLEETRQMMSPEYQQRYGLNAHDFIDLIERKRVCEAIQHYLLYLRVGREGQ